MDEGQRRVGGLVEVPGLLHEFGIDPAEVAAGIGLDLRTLDNSENMIPFTMAAALYQASAARTECPHFGLLVGQRCDTRILGLVGELMRNAPSWGRALQDLVDNQHRYVRGGMPYQVVRDGMVFVGFAIYQRGIEGVDHLCDAAIAIGFNMMRELCGALPEEILLSRKAPSDARPYHRFYRVPLRACQESTAPSERLFGLIV
jgi:hypothetical protein